MKELIRIENYSYRRLRIKVGLYTYLCHIISQNSEFNAEFLYFQKTSLIS